MAQLITGLMLVAVSATAFACHMRRVIAANATDRLPWFSDPPTRPRLALLTFGLALILLLLGLTTLDAYHRPGFFASLLVVFAPMIFLQLKHNRHV